jgi:hypothetical protein
VQTAAGNKTQVLMSGCRLLVRRLIDMMSGEASQMEGLVVKMAQQRAGNGATQVDDAAERGNGVRVTEWV